jgi:hypothetical protein
MALVGEIVRRAMGRLGLIDANEAIQAADLSVCVVAVQEMIDSMRAGAFGVLVDVFSQESLTAETMTRVIGSNIAGITVTLPNTAPDNAPLRDGDMIEVRDLFTTISTEYRYSTETARWEPLLIMSESTVFPLGQKNEGGFIAALAVRISDDFGVQPSPLVVRDAGAWKRNMLARHEGKRPAVGLYF